MISSSIKLKGATRSSVVSAARRNSCLDLGLVGGASTTSIIPSSSSLHQSTSHSSFWNVMGLSSSTSTSTRGAGAANRGKRKFSLATTQQLISPPIQFNSQLLQSQFRFQSNSSRNSFFFFRSAAPRRKHSPFFHPEPEPEVANKSQKVERKFFEKETHPAVDEDATAHVSANAIVEKAVSYIPRNGRPNIVVDFEQHKQPLTQLSSSSQSSKIPFPIPIKRKDQAATLSTSTSINSSNNPSSKNTFSQTLHLTLGYSLPQMYELAARTGNYKNFLPFCLESSVLSTSASSFPSNENINPNSVDADSIPSSFQGGFLQTGSLTTQKVLLSLGTTTSKNSGPSSTSSSNSSWSTMSLLPKIYFISKVQLYHNQKVVAVLADNDEPLSKAVSTTAVQPVRNTGGGPSWGEGRSGDEMSKAMTEDAKSQVNASTSAFISKAFSYFPTPWDMPAKAASQKVPSSKASSSPKVKSRVESGNSSLFKDVRCVWTFSSLPPSSSAIEEQIVVTSSSQTTMNSSNLNTLMINAFKKQKSNQISSAVRASSTLNQGEEVWPSQCTINLHVSFEFKSSLHTALLPTLVFEKACQSVLEAFKDRAYELYGPPTPI